MKKLLLALAMTASAVVLSQSASSPPVSAGTGVECDIVNGCEDYTTRLVRIANEEWNRWDYGRTQECNNVTRVDSYWASAGSLSGCRDAWSAAFISWVQMQAGDDGAFTASNSHSTYIVQGIDDREAGRSALYKTYRSSELEPRLGDLVCRGRDTASGYDYDDMKSVRAFTSHCDLVVWASTTHIAVIGGNVSPASGVTCRYGDSGCTVNRKFLSLTNGKLSFADAAVVMRLNVTNPNPPGGPF